MYSALVGVASDATASLTVIGAAVLLQIFTDATVNVVAGQVYNVVSVVAARSAIPSLPVAIIYSPCCI
jgi:hypothetical protein